MTKIGERYGWKTCAIVVCYNEDALIGPCLAQLQPYVDQLVVFHSTQPWNPPRWPLDGTLGVIQKYFPDAEVIVKYWPLETPQRNETLEWAQTHGFTYAMVVDADEFYTTDWLEWLAGRDWLGRDWKGVRVRQKHYWRTLDHRLQPLDTWTPAVLVRTDQRYRIIRDMECGLENQYLVNDALPDGSVLFMHHLSFARTLPRVLLKMLNSSHNDAVGGHWWNRWKSNSVTADSESRESCWPYPGANMIPVEDPAPDEIKRLIAEWAPKVQEFQTLDLYQVCAQLGYPLR